MRNWNGKRYWLVGASEGLGRALAETMSRMGTELVLSARSADRLNDLARNLPGKAEVVTIDVASRESVEAAAATVGEIDGLIYLAGVYWPVSADEWDVDRGEAMADINFTGAVRTVGAVIPGFVERGCGHVVLTGSLSGFRGLPGATGYAASKAGVMALAESMYADLRGSGIEVQLANPGFIRTRLTEKNDFRMPFIMSPEEAAGEMFDHMSHGGFKKSFPFLFSLLFRGSLFLPDWAYYRLFRNSA